VVLCVNSECVCVYNVCVCVCMCMCVCVCVCDVCGVGMMYLSVMCVDVGVGGCVLV